MRFWSRAELWLFSALLSFAGILVLAIPSLVIGAGFQSLTPPVQRLLEAIGVSVFLGGTVSFGVQELVRARTRKEFEIQLQRLLERASDEQSSQLRGFLRQYISDLAQLTEQLRQEVHGSNIRMIFSSRDKGLEEMGTAIRNAESFVYVMGISIREFFQLDTPCSRAISETYHERKGIEFKILILNNRSPEALDRSNREEGVAFKDVDDLEYKNKTLFRETRETIINTQRYVPDMALRVYDRQSLFLLITDKVAFMEPYHYGERVVGEHPLQAPFLRRVAELVPLIEFERAGKRGPYEQFLGHFEYVFEKAKEPTEENIQI